jgi:hypothetical protein
MSPEEHGSITAVTDSSPTDVSSFVDVEPQEQEEGINSIDTADSSQSEGYDSILITANSFSAGEGFDLSWWEDDDDDHEHGDDETLEGTEEHRLNEESRKSAWLSASKGRVGTGMKIEDVIATYDEWLVQHREGQKKEDEKKHVIFCDLDGVLADFDAGVYRLFKKKPAEISPKVLWPRLATTEGFYESLPWTEGTAAMELLHYATPNSVTYIRL